MRTKLVRKGKDVTLPDHTPRAVYSEMILQIARDYPGIPDVRTLALSEIRFFYEGLRHELQRGTQPKTDPA